MMPVYPTSPSVALLRPTAEAGVRVREGEAPAYSEVDVPHWFEIASELRLHRPRTDTPPETQIGAARRYVVVLASGPEDEGRRATLAFAAACTALSLDLDTQVFLIGDGSHWAYVGASDGVHQKGFPPLGELMGSFLELGGEVSICSSCDGVCSLPGPDGRNRQRRREIHPRGLAAVLAHMIGGTSLTF